VPFGFPVVNDHTADAPVHHFGTRQQIHPIGAGAIQQLQLPMLTIPFHHEISPLILAPQAKIVAAYVQHLRIVGEVHHLRRHPVSSLHSKREAIVDGAHRFVIVQNTAGPIRHDFQSALAVVGVVDCGFSLFAEA